MFSASAEFYDLIYSTFKDYPGEAAHIASLLRLSNPQCRTVIDVACGTGEHARLLAAEGFVVDGLDLDPAFVRIARQKHPSGRFFECDMSDFHLPHRYGAVVCARRTRPDACYTKQRRGQRRPRHPRESRGS